MHLRCLPEVGSSLSRSPRASDRPKRMRRKEGNNRHKQGRCGGKRERRGRNDSFAQQRRGGQTSQQHAYAAQHTKTDTQAQGERRAKGKEQGNYHDSKEKEEWGRNGFRVCLAMALGPKVSAGELDGLAVFNSLCECQAHIGEFTQGPVNAGLRCKQRQHNHVLVAHALLAQQLQGVDNCRSRVCLPQRNDECLL